MRCPNCASEMAAGSRFCTRCGASLVPVPAAPAAPTPAAAAGPVAVPVSASSIVYLFGDRFVQRDTALTAGERLPCSEIKVRKHDLAEAMFLAAFAALAQEGLLALNPGQKKGLIFKSNAVSVTVTRQAARDPGGLEARILRAMTGDPRKDWVEHLVYDAIGDTSTDPHGASIELVKDDLFRLGFFAQGERSGAGKLLGPKLVPLCDRIAALQPHVPSVQSFLSNLQNANPSTYKQLHEDIKKGIRSRLQTLESDPDGAYPFEH